MSIFQSFLRSIVDIIMPAQCIGCQAIGNHLCERCVATIPFRQQEKFGIHTVIDQLFIAGHANNTLLSHAIHTFKYRFVSELASPLASYLVNALARYQDGRTLFADNPLVVPVPLHTKRLAERGFNQSELLAQHLASSLGMRIRSDILIRSRYTPSQVKTNSRQERLENMKNAFSINHPEFIEGLSIILVDDVSTTGATLDACATALKSAGASSVSAIVLARG